ncbi:hypothetical protein KPH14_003154 [Odynerus spinipes]|uniref:Uncharacterized protein n=1 Tax=Odynerus spinipes TaxID=1348599 RepID=A0AAD9VUG6_9HYME|nr:hypothetical protein KPH14_003154 [Odynerus spinipes]
MTEIFFLCSDGDSDRRIYRSVFLLKSSINMRFFSIVYTIMMCLIVASIIIGVAPQTNNKTTKRTHGRHHARPSIIAVPPKMCPSGERVDRIGVCRPVD